MEIPLMHKLTGEMILSSSDSHFNVKANNIINENVIINETIIPLINLENPPYVFELLILLIIYPTLAFSNVYGDMSEFITINKKSQTRMFVITFKLFA